MKLIEALGILRGAPAGGAAYRVLVACGFTPLHLATFVAAHAQRSMVERRVETRAGLYGNLAQTLETCELDALDAVVIVVEWADLDARLGLRSLGGWSATLDDVVEGVGAMAGRIAAALPRLAERVPVALALPTLPLPPAFLTRRAQAGRPELAIRARVAELAAAAAGLRGVRVASPQALDERSPLAQRADPRAELLHGFPYALGHASALGEQLATLARPPPRKKGIVTDLDDTLWRGIVGDVGPEAVSWTLEGKAQLHGLYQQLLRSLADAGVLVAVASKNDPRVVDQAFARPDVVLGREKVYPLEVHWGAKSESVRRILAAWNVGPDSVVVVDDSPMELAEIAAAHPGVETRLFPTHDEAAGLELLRSLRDAFGVERVSEEDLLRQGSLRSAAGQGGGENAFTAAPEEFLRAAQAEVTISLATSPPDERALELINKTNQFNLNGLRIEEGAFRHSLERPGAFLAVVSYRDRFGPLGKIAVAAGRVEPGRLRVERWVMSCRAFGRRVEHRCVAELFAAFDVPELLFEYAETARNGPTRDFFGGIGVSPRDGGIVVARDAFAAACPPLYHEVKITR